MMKKQPKRYDAVTGQQTFAVTSQQTFAFASRSQPDENHIQYFGRSCYGDLLKLKFSD